MSAGMACNDAKKAPVVTLYVARVQRRFDFWDETLWFYMSSFSRPCPCGCIK